MIVTTNKILISAIICQNSSNLTEFIQEKVCEVYGLLSWSSSFKWGRIEYNNSLLSGLK